MRAASRSCLRDNRPVAFEVIKEHSAGVRLAVEHGGAATTGDLAVRVLDLDDTLLREVEQHRARLHGSKALFAGHLIDHPKRRQLVRLTEAQRLPECLA